MPTLSFKTDVKFRDTLQTLAANKGINTSAYIKLLLTKEMNSELAVVTANGLTVAEEIRLLRIAAEDEMVGPFTDAKSLLQALRK